MKTLILFGLMSALAVGAHADSSDNGNLTIGGQGLIVGTMTVRGNAFSVGGSTLACYNGRVGVGTTNPGYSLDVQGGGVNASGGFFWNGQSLDSRYAPLSGGGYVNKTGDTMTGQLTLSGSTLTVTGNAFSVGGSTFAVTGGNVGVGTANPGAALEVNWPYNGGVFMGQQASTNVGLHAYSIHPNNVLYMDAVPWNNRSTNTTLLYFQSIGGGATTAFGGNVGVGTTNPQATLNVIGSPTPLSIQDAANENVLTILNSNNGSVSIGTATVMNKLTVAGPTNDPGASGSAVPDGMVRFVDIAGSRDLDIGISGSNGAWLQSRDKNNYAVFYSLNLQPKGGNVGIGTANPGYSFQVNGTSVAFGTTANVGSAGNAYVAVANSIQATTILGTNVDLSVFNQGGPAGYYGTQIGLGYNSGAAGQYYPVTIGSRIVSSSNQSSAAFIVATRNATSGTTAPTERFTVDSTGNVGIGTVTPGQALEVNGNTLLDGNLFQINNSGTPELYLNKLGTRGWSIRNDGAFKVFNWQDSNYYLTILNGGNVGIGMTNPGYNLDVNGGSSASVRTSTSVLLAAGGICFGDTSHCQYGSGALLSGNNTWTGTAAFQSSFTATGSVHNASTTIKTSAFTIAASAIGPCVTGSTLTITTRGNIVRMEASLTMNANGGADSEVWAAFLRDGAPIVSRGVAETFMKGSSGGGMTVIQYDTPSAGSHSYCLSAWVNVTSQTTPPDSGTADVFAVEELQ